MTVITITRKSKCKDCIFLKERWIYKRKLHECGNKESEEYKSQRRMNDFVCDKWALQ